MPLSKGKCDGAKPRQEDVESAAAQLNERNLVGNRSLIDLGELKSLGGVVCEFTFSSWFWFMGMITRVHL